VRLLSEIAHIRKHSFRLNWNSGICDQVVTTDTANRLIYPTIPTSTP
jgi:hypothetical protein